MSLIKRKLKKKFHQIETSPKINYEIRSINKIQIVMFCLFFSHLPIPKRKEIVAFR
jgi:hypothetical protein